MAIIKTSFVDALTSSANLQTYAHLLVGPNASAATKNLTVSGNTTVDGTSTLTGNTTVGGTLGVTGTTTAAAVACTSLTIGGVTVNPTAATPGLVRLDSKTVSNGVSLTFDPDGDGTGSTIDYGNYATFVIEIHRAYSTTYHSTCKVQIQRGSTWTSFLGDAATIQLKNSSTASANGTYTLTNVNNEHASTNECILADSLGQGQGASGYPTNWNYGYSANEPLGHSIGYIVHNSSAVNRIRLTRNEGQNISAIATLWGWNDAT